MERSLARYQLNQDGRDYVCNTSIVDDRVRILVQDGLALDGPCYSGE